MGANASLCRPDCLESILGGRGWDPSSHKPLMKGHLLKIQETTKSTQVAAGGSLTHIGLLRLHQVFNSLSAPRNGSEEGTSTGCPLSRSIITLKSVPVGNGRRCAKEMSNSTHPYKFVYIVEPVVTCSCCIILLGSVVCVFTGSSLPENITRSHITSTCCCVA